jgi:immune inhibitor A
MKRKLLAVLTILIVVGMLPGTALASPARSDGVNGSPAYAPKPDNLPDPLTTAQLELKEKALEAKLNGKAYGKVGEVARGQYVELAREGEGAIWTVLGQFADLAHNGFTQPDRTVDNTNYWVPDFSRQHYLDMFFNSAPGANSMRNFYIEQSSGRYTVYGDVTDWVTVPGNAVTYDDNPDANVWNFLQDSINSWYADQISAGKTPAQINDYLKQFDVYDRYDYDGDGNFDEPDGYIDTFQSVHAGPGEEAGAPAWTIWSHSWYAHYELEGIAGPDFNKLGGIKIGDSNYWVGKYTIQPEDGGVGVFTHEYGHDLGLPDLYDTSGGENGTGFWTLMSSGSWVDEGKDSIGNKPSHMGAWEKFELGWLNYQVASAGKAATFKLGPMEFNTKQAQALFVVLPQKPVTAHIADPFEGSKFYFSGSKNNINSTMTKAFTLSAGATLTAKVNYGIEVGFDFANVIVSTDGGATWQTVPTNLSNSMVEANGIDGFSNGWVDLTADLPAGNVMVGFRYKSDGGVNYDGFMVDNIQITGYPLDGAETDAGWTFAGGFVTTTGTESKLYNQYYVVEFRTYKGYDNGLKTGPYYFGYPTMPDYVDHFAYQDGMLINYWDTSQANNDTYDHPGQGLLLPVDAHPQALKRCGGPAIWRNRVQSYDSTFTLTPTDGIPNIHQAGVLCPVPSLPAVSAFNDRNSYYDPANPWGSVITPNTGTIIRLVSISAQDSFMQVEVRPAK